MTHLRTLILAMLVSALAAPGFAGSCYADYKAKKDNPLRLHYGVVELYGDCTRQSARAEISTRIARDGWKLLNVLSVFDGSQLAGKGSSAGKFYLRY